MKILLSVLLMGFASIASADVDPGLIGTYTGCGQSSAFGARQAVFHLTALPTSSPGVMQYSGSFTWYQGPSAIYFTEVSGSSGRLFMRTEIQPSRDFGTIINTLEITANADGTISGAYRTNSMQSDGRILSGDFVARRIGNGAIPRLNCQ